ncbi:hypothetical protein [Frankia sp. AgKG'84/4]|uniref:hypothetical protein n=1 Tax=Frankia sp. AgKG'84/4 TaxID=573490 RepID=UPI00200E06A3|nr:hypothetical protein [Frankia sp. AgKG'84/4]MCL9795166.1 hypothetical protein [Frankia sp. AgKG'84/4]
MMATTAACATGSDRNVATGATSTPAATNVALSPHVTQHQFHAGESFTYFYDSTGATYATQQAADGQVPRVTDLQKVAEIRALVRISILSQAGRLAKKFELLDTRYREVGKDDTQSGRPPVAFRTIQSLVPGFPADFSYTYPVGGDNDVARNLNVVFKDHPDPRLFQLVDIFTWLGAPAGIPSTLGVGQVIIKPPVDVNLFGVTFHNNSSVVSFDRVDHADGVDQAYFKNQTPGNYFEALGTDTNVQSTFHVPLTGSATGLVSNGELQELAYQGGRGGTPRTATQRQVSFVLQTLGTRSAVDAYTFDLKPRTAS